MQETAYHVNMGKDGFGCWSFCNGFQEACGVTPVGQPQSPKVECGGVKDMDVGVGSLERRQAMRQAPCCHLHPVSSQCQL